MSIRVRLTLLYSGVLTATLVLFSLLLYFFMAHNLAAGIDTDLAEQAASIRIVYTDPDLQTVIIPNFNVFTAPNTYLQVVRIDGVIVAHSRNLGGQALPFSNDTLKIAKTGKSFYETNGTGRQRLRTFNEPIIWSNRIIGVLQVGRSLGPVEDDLEKLRLILILGGLMAVMIASMLGWFLAKSTLHPIERITVTAASIQQAEDLQRRVEYKGPNDEIGRLTETLNSMLDRLQGAYQRLEEAHASQRRFVSDASHELRTPLTTIRGNVELLQKIGMEHPEIREEALNDIASESKRMSRLVADLLALARADAGLKLLRKPIQLADLFDETSRLAKMSADGRQFYPEISDNISDIKIEGDYDYLKQLLLVLLSNAFKYTPPDGTVRFYIKKEAENQVCLVVEDNGPGIAPEHLTHIFDRFYRVDQARFGGSTGLGLAIGQWIARQHGSAISVESTVGQGSTFTVCFPVLI